MIKTIEDAKRLMEMIKENNFKLTFFNETEFTTKYLYRTDKQRFMRVKDTQDDQERGTLTAEMVLEDADLINKYFEDSLNLKEFTDRCGQF
jgi:hypothetical protein